MIRWRRLFLCVFTYAQFASVVPAFSENHGIVSYQLDWHTSRQTYTYVFSGVVTCQGRPCANTQVHVDIDTPSQGVVSQATTTSPDGRYLLQVSVEGDADDTTTWKLLAEAGGPNHGEPTEIEGRSILMQDQTTVPIERLLQIQQG